MAEFVRPRAARFYDPSTPAYLDEQGVLHLFDDASCRAVLGDRTGLFSRNPKGFLPPGTDYHPTLDFMWFEDDPQHSILRTSAARWFGPSVLEELESVTWNHAYGLLRRHTLPDGRLHLSHFSYDLAFWTICSFMGFPMEHEDVLREELERAGQAQDLFALAPNPAAAAVYWETIAERLASPKNELLDALIHAWLEGRATKRQLVAYLYGFLAAGRDTTGTALNDAMVVLTLEDKLGWFMTRHSNKAALKVACHELVRYLSTSFPTHPAPTTTRGWEVQGIMVPPGTRCELHLSAANFDPAINAGNADAAPPTVLDLTREPNRYIGFGAGAHYCLGAHLAPMVMRVGVLALATAGYQFDPDSPLVRVPGITDGVTESYCVRR